MGVSHILGGMEDSSASALSLEKDLFPIYLCSNNLAFQGLLQKFWQGETRQYWSLYGGYDGNPRTPQEVMNELILQNPKHIGIKSPPGFHSTSTRDTGWLWLYIWLLQPGAKDSLKVWLRNKDLATHLFTFCDKSMRLGSERKTFSCNSPSIFSILESHFEAVISHISRVMDELLEERAAEEGVTEGGAAEEGVTEGGAAEEGVTEEVTPPKYQPGG